MAMTRRDYETIAEVISRNGQTSEERERWAVAFATRLRAGNPRFDAFRFVKACRVVGSADRLRTLANRADAEHPMFA